MNNRLWASHRSDDVGEYDPVFAAENALKSSARASLYCTEEGNSMAHIQILEEYSENVNFRLMNPHPSIFLTLEESSTNHANQASGVMNGKILDRDSRTCGRFRNPTVPIDLTQMIEPPLLSNWIPGEVLKSDNDEALLEQSLDFEVTSTDDSPHGDLSKKQQVCDIKRFVHRLLHDGFTCQNTSKRLVNDENMKDSLTCLSVNDWIEVLPSHQFLSALNEINIQSTLPILRHLFRCCSTRELGVYILTIIIPVLFQSIALNVSDQKNGEQMNELAVLLIDHCSLRNLRKDQLFGMLKSIPMSSLGVELRISMAQAYYKYNR
jgi:hypothetical protein